MQSKHIICKQGTNHFPFFLCINCTNQNFQTETDNLDQWHKIILYLIMNQDWTTNPSEPSNINNNPTSINTCNIFGTSQSATSLTINKRKKNETKTMEVSTKKMKTTEAPASLTISGPPQQIPYQVTNIQPWTPQPFPNHISFNIHPGHFYHHHHRHQFKSQYPCHQL